MMGPKCARYAQFFYSIYLLTTHKTRTTNHTLPNHYLTAAAAAINTNNNTAAVNEMGKCLAYKVHSFFYLLTTHESRTTNHTLCNHSPLLLQEAETPDTSIHAHFCSFSSFKYLKIVTYSIFIILYYIKLIKPTKPRVRVRVGYGWLALNP